MFRAKRKHSVVGVGNGEAKGDKSRSRSPVSISLNPSKGGTAAGGKGSSPSNDKHSPRSHRGGIGAFLDADKKQRRSRPEMVTAKLLPDCNQLHPDSIFVNDRRYSFTGYGAQQRRASYDKYHMVDNGELANVERRASYDVSYLKTDTLRVNEDPKSTRRDSLVRRWLDRLSNAAEAHKSKDHKQKNDRSSDVSSILDNCENGSESAAKTKENENRENTSSAPVSTRHVQDELTPHGNDSAAKKIGSGGSGGTSPGTRKKHVPIVEPPRLTTEVPLIEPSQVLVSQRPILTAEPVLTPLERLRRKDEVIKEALLEKQKLVASILHVPKEEFETIADIAAEPAYDKEASELVLAAVNQADQLTSILNECLRLTEEDVVAAGCEVNVNAANKSSNSSSSSVRTLPAVPVPRLQSITHSLSAHLTQLLTLMTERDEEREKLRQELQRSREQLHTMYEMEQRFQRISDQSPLPNESAKNSSTNESHIDETVESSQFDSNVKK